MEAAAAEQQVRFSPPANEGVARLGYPKAAASVSSPPPKTVGAIPGRLETFASCKARHGFIAFRFSQAQVRATHLEPRRCCRRIRPFRPGSPVIPCKLRQSSPRQPSMELAI